MPGVVGGIYKVTIYLCHLQECGHALRNDSGPFGMHLLDMLFLNGSYAYLACMCLGCVGFTVYPQEFGQALRNSSGPCNASCI